MIRVFILIPLLTLLLAGCTMAPKDERPPLPVAQTWLQQPATTNSTNAADITWQQFFDDPRLQSLIGLSLTNNRDLRVASLRVEQSRAQFRIQRSALLPNVDAGGSFLRQQIPRTISANGQKLTTSTYDVSVGASYEIDLFGRVQSLKNEALERYLASDASRSAAQIALISEVASQYIALLQSEAAKTLAQNTLEAVTASYNLNKSSFEAGVASELDLRTAEAQVQTARVDVATYSQLLAQAQNALVFLIGQPLPNDLPPIRPLHEQHLLAEMPVGLPSDLLQRRPDIIAAEHTLKAANANIGAARAAFFPQILLTGSAGTTSAKLTDLFTGPSAAWSFSPQITVPIFQGGRNRANLDVSKLGKEIEIANYDRAIQTAFREVADSLSVRQFVDEKLTSQQLLVQAQQKRFDLTNARYKQGVDNYVVVLLAQQDLHAAQQNLIQFQASRLLNAITLYRSLGGGWKS